MGRIRRLTVAALVLAAALVPARPASAGQLWDWLCDHCPPPSYSPFRLWAPRAARVSDRVHGPKLDVYPPDRHPEIPPTFTILKYSCPAVDPAATLIEPPTPPATSRFRY
jgi:hypothetical protein